MEEKTYTILARKTILDEYNRLCAVVSDINEHLPIIQKYASQCQHVTECGVRNVVSSWAQAYGLLQSQNSKMQLIGIDPIKGSAVDSFGLQCQAANIDFKFYEESDLTCPIEETDLLFIDTWHIYGLLKRELKRWGPYVRKFILLHDTTIDEWKGENIRCGASDADAEAQSKVTGIPVHEIQKGLWPAITEYLSNHPEWRIKERFVNNNGLTVLEKIHVKGKRQIERAMYGYGNHFQDVTHIMKQTMMAQDELTVNNITMGGDPIFGRSKHIQVSFMDGTTQTWAEGEEIDSSDWIKS